MPLSVCQRAGRPSAHAFRSLSVKSFIQITSAFLYILTAGSLINEWICGRVGPISSLMVPKILSWKRRHTLPSYFVWYSPENIKFLYYFSPTSDSEIIEDGLDFRFLVLTWKMVCQLRCNGIVCAAKVVKFVTFSPHFDHPLAPK